MNRISIQGKFVFCALLIWSFLFGNLPSKAQDIVPISDITGGASIFVFRQLKAAVLKKIVDRAVFRRTKTQRVETARKVTKQIAAVSKTAPRRARFKAVDPATISGNADKPAGKDSAKSFAGVGEYSLEKDDFDKAIESFREAVRLDNENTEAKNGLSEALAAKGNRFLTEEKEQAAKSFFEESLKYNEKNALAYFGLGSVADDADNSKEAAVNYEKALQLDKDLTEIYSPLGVVYYQTGEIAKANDLLEKSLLAGKDDFETQYYLGLVRFSQNRNRDALAAFKRAIKFDANSAEANFYIGETFVRFDRHKDAVAAYQEAIRLKPKYFEAIFAQGAAFYEIKKYDDAVRCFEEAKNLKQGVPEIFVNLGNAHREAGNFIEAEANYHLATVYMQKTNDFDRQELAEIHGYIGYVILKQCDINLQNGIACKWDTAIWNFEKAVAVGKNAVDITNLGWAYHNLAKLNADDEKDLPNPKNKLEKAKTAFQKAIEANPKFVEVPQMNLGLVSIELGDYPAAINALKPIAAKRGDWIYVNYALGIAYRKNEDLPNAIKQFRKVLVKEPTYVAAMVGLGEAEFRSNNRKEAQKIISNLKKLNSDEAKKLETLFSGAKIVQ